MIRHILKDGTVLTDITGHVVRVQGAERFYSLVNQLGQKRDEKSRDAKSGSSK